MSELRHERGLWHNPISIMGIILSFVAGFLIVVFLVLDALGGGHSAYLGILTYMVLPAFLAAASAVFLLGMWREQRRRATAAPAEVSPFPVLDLNLPRQRLRFAMYVGGALLTFAVMGVVSYEAYHFTESVAFCGEICHPVMIPEYTAYQRSPHSRVPCVECHIGGGASWYVKAKISGLRQVWATLVGSYHRPIATPIDNLRPARETCEECHWPGKFYGGKLFVSPRFAYDEKNTPRTLSMLVLTGGEGGEKQGGGGIHWHMLMGNKVTYQAADRRQQVIARVWSEKPDGVRTEYVLRDGGPGSAGTAGEGGEMVREVDCVTCHNRPTHIYRSPEVNVDAALLAGKIDPALPFVKRKAVELLIAPYKDDAEAEEAIGRGFTSFYGERYPAVARARGDAIKTATEAVREIHRTNFFPAMKADWRAYPDHVGHRDFPGCFRCHDGRHLSAGGKAITRDCGACHTIPALGPLQRWSAGYPTGREPWHPWALRGAHEAMDCDRCHDGGLPRSSTCAGCHRHSLEAPMGKMNCSDCHQGEEGQVVRPLEDCRVCHDDLTGLHRRPAGHKTGECLTCHRPHEWKTPGREACLVCHENRKEHNAGKPCASCHAFAGKD